MRRTAARVAHVVQAIENGNQVEIVFADIFGRSGFKPHPVADPMGCCMFTRFGNRGFVEIKADKFAVGIGFGH